MGLWVGGWGLGVVVTGVVHRVGPLAHQADALVEAERTGGGECRVLAEAVAGAEARLDTETLHCVEHDQAADEGGELGVARVLQFVGVGVEQQARDVAVGDGRGLVDQLPALVVGPWPAHAGALGALARKREGKHRVATLDPGSEVPNATDG